jgi:hypothetical protein
VQRPAKLQRGVRHIIARMGKEIIAAWLQLDAQLGDLPVLRRSKGFLGTLVIDQFLMRLSPARA